MLKCNRQIIALLYSMKLPRPIVSATVAEEWIAFCNIVSGIWVGIVFATVEKGIGTCRYCCKVDGDGLSGWMAGDLP